MNVPHFKLHSRVSRQLGCLHVLAVVTSSSESMGVGLVSFYHEKNVAVIRHLADKWNTCPVSTPCEVQQEKQKWKQNPCLQGFYSQVRGGNRLENKIREPLTNPVERPIDGRDSGWGTGCRAVGARGRDRMEMTFGQIQWKAVMTY